MTIEERNAIAQSYSARCARKRARDKARRLRRIQRALMYCTPFAAGVCVIGGLLVLL